MGDQRTAAHVFGREGRAVLQVRIYTDFAGPNSPELLFLRIKLLEYT